VVREIPIMETPVSGEKNQTEDIAIIEVSGLGKSYGSVQALKEVSFRVSQKTIVALIGPNGAGKSTLVEILMGVRRPGHGKVQVLGCDVVKHPAAILDDIGVQLQESKLFTRLTAREYFTFFQKLYVRAMTTQALCEKLDIAGILDKPIGKLSGGQRQRIALGLALINDPHLVILDEPTVGLDPITRREFWALIRELKVAGKTVLFSTHYMEEAQALADQVIMIANGQLVGIGTVGDVIKQAGQTEPVSTLEEAYAVLSRATLGEAA